MATKKQKREAGEAKRKAQADLELAKAKFRNQHIPRIRDWRLDDDRLERARLRNGLVPVGITYGAMP